MVKPVLRVILASLCLVLLASHAVNGRYLPTRSNEDSLDKLRDLLRDILDSDKSPHSSGSLYESAVHYPPYGGPKYLRKREASGWDFYDPTSVQKPQPFH